MQVEQLRQEVYTTADVAYLVGVLAETVTYWIRIGRLKAWKAAGMWLIPRTEVERLLKRERESRPRNRR